MYSLLPWDDPIGSPFVKFDPVTLGLLTSRVVGSMSLFLINYSASGMMLLKHKIDRVWGVCSRGGGRVRKGKGGERQRQRDFRGNQLSVDAADLSPKTHQLWNSEI